VGRKPQNSANLVAFLHIIDTSRLMKILRGDKTAILHATAKAEEAASLLLKLGRRAIADNAGEPDDFALAA